MRSTLDIQGLDIAVCLPVHLTWGSRRVMPFLDWQARAAANVTAEPKQVSKVGCAIK